MSQEERRGHESTIRSFYYQRVCWGTKRFTKDIETALGGKCEEEVFDRAAERVVEGELSAKVIKGQKAD
jgi:hypothetical protein